MEITIQAHQALLPFVNEEESAQLMASAPQIIPEILDGLKHALRRTSHRSNKYSLNLSAKGFLLLLKEMAASHESCADKMVESGVLPLILSYIGCDPDIHYWSVRRAAECLWTLVQIGKDKHVDAVRELTAIEPRISFASILFSPYRIFTILLSFSFVSPA